MMKRILILGFALLCLVSCGDDKGSPGPPPPAAETYNFTLGGRIESPLVFFTPPSPTPSMVIRVVGNWQVDEQKRVMKVEIDSRVIGIPIGTYVPGFVTQEHQFKLKYGNRYLGGLFRGTQIATIPAEVTIGPDDWSDEFKIDIFDRNGGLVDDDFAYIAD